LGLGEVDTAGIECARAALGEIAAEEVTASLVRAGVRVRGLAVVRPGLEELFVELTGEGFDVAR
jgi:ABC-2 type transport system ATP-binding protein